MRILTCFVLVFGVIGIAACNPGSAGAEPPLAHPTVKQVAVKPVTVKQVVVEQVVADESTHVIEIHKMKFQTKMLNVKVGDTVTWINKDIVPHTVTASDKSWDSGRLKKGESFTLTVTDQTKLDYYCFYHRQMKAKLAVGTTR